jgi:hypothetical protein
MSIVDRQRIAAVKAMEAMGYTFDGVSWDAPVPTPAGSVANLAPEADAMRTLLVLRADKLANCTEGSDEELELRLIADIVTAYEDKRWPEGRVSGGKG